MSDFKTKMQQIQFPLGLRPRSRWGSLQRSPDLLAVFKEGRISKGKEGKGGREGERKGGYRGRGEGRGWNGKGKEGKGGKTEEWEHAPIGIFESRRL